MNMPLVLLNRRRRAGGFSPQSVLFGLNEPGIFLDPSDQTTLFQDAAGTTPVTTPGQTVALALDKSKGLVPGPELVTNGDFSNGLTGWTDASSAPATFTVSGGQGLLTSSGTTARARQTLTTVAGRTYRVEFDAVAIDASGCSLNCSGVAAGTTDIFAAPVTTGRFSRLFVATSTTTYFQWGRSTTGTLTFDNVSVKELSGFHATQATTASRPLYALLPANGVRNLANGSASPSNNTYWSASQSGNGVTITRIATGVDGDGLPYADYTVVGTATASNILTPTTISALRVAAAVGQQFTTSFSAQVISGTAPTGLSGVRAEIIGETSALAQNEAFNSAIQNATSETTVTVTGTLAVAGSVFARPQVAIRTDNGATVNYTIRIKALQFERASARTAYQFNYGRTNIAQPPFAQVGALLFDGVDDFMVTPSIDFSATDKMTVFAGVRKLSDAARAFVFVQENAGLQRISIEAPSTTLNNYVATSGGTLNVGVSTAAAAPNTSVLSMSGSISPANLTLRLNGVQVAQSTSTQGTGNYSSQPIFIGRFAGTSLPFNGYLYQLIVRGAATSATDITATETWVNSKTGAY